MTGHILRQSRRALPEAGDALMLKPRSGLILALALGILAIIASLAIRPLMPPDETRYVQVAREMRLSGNFVVPHFEGEPYPDKPPLLFWLMNLAWMLLGDHGWVARMISPTTGLLCVALTWWIARRLWPDRADVAGTAALILAGGLAWCGYSTLVMFDAPLTACVLGALGAGLLAARRVATSMSPFVLVGACLGLGILAKGPMTLLHALPALLAAPMWIRHADDARKESFPWRRWYGGLVAAFVIGAAIALCWALPAAARGGPEFGLDMLWNQTANRMVRAFAHARPPWWYLLVLPIALAPWSLWLGAWTAMGRLRAEMDPGLRFCLAWIVPGFALLSLVSGKQAHYLLPLLPGIALMLARLLGPAPRVTQRNVLPVALGFAAVGIALLAVGSFARAHAGALPEGMTPAFVHLRLVEPWLLVLVGVVLAIGLPRLRTGHVAALALAGVLGVVLVQASITGWGGAHRRTWPPWQEKHGDGETGRSPDPVMAARP